VRRLDVREVRPRKFAQLALIRERALLENNKGLAARCPNPLTEIVRLRIPKVAS
jgi:hypothetical protein